MKTAIIKLKFVQIENNITAISCNARKSQKTEKVIWSKSSILSYL